MTVAFAGVDDVTSGRLGLAAGQRLLRLLSAALPLVWSAYALFDRAFAWIHVPGVPLFAGELLVAATIGVVMLATPYVRPASPSGPMGVLVLLMLWGVVRTIPGVGEYSLDAIRDAALWYYGFFAVLVVALVNADPELPARWVQGFRRFLPFLLAWAPVAVLLDRLASEDTGLLVPDSEVAIFSHKPGNVGVLLAVSMAAVWLVPGVADPRRRLVLSGAAIGGLAVVGSQNRGGLVSALVAIGVAWLFTGNRVRLLVQGVTLVVALLGIGWAADVRIPAGDRDISVPQLVSNVVSITGEDVDAKGSLEGTVEWRSRLWDRVLTATVEQDRLAFGWGFGPNLGQEFFGADGGGDGLRSPHNSHLDVIARMGLLGTALWAGLWASWFWSVVRGRRRLLARGDDLGAGLCGVAVVGAVAALVNAYFDPSLESAQAAITLWALFGLGAGLSARARRRRPAGAPLAAG